MKTRKITYEVDTPDDVSDEDLEGTFAEAILGMPVLTGWWISPRAEITPVVNWREQPLWRRVLAGLAGL